MWMLNAFCSPDTHVALRLRDFSHRRQASWRKAQYMCTLMKNHRWWSLCLAIASTKYIIRFMRGIYHAVHPTRPALYLAPATLFLPFSLSLFHYLLSRAHPPSRHNTTLPTASYGDVVFTVFWPPTRISWYRFQLSYRWVLFNGSIASERVIHLHKKENYYFLGV